MGTLDLQTPIGLLLSIIGFLLASFGLFGSDPGIYMKSLGWNVNFWWGSVLLVTGLVLLLAARRAASRSRS